MTILFAGTSVNDFIYGTVPNIISNETSPYMSPGCVEMVYADEVAQGPIKAVIPATSEIGVAWYGAYLSTYSATEPMFAIRNTTLDADMVRLVKQADGQVGFTYRQSNGSYTAPVVISGLTANNLQRYDIHISIAEVGFIRGYWNGEIVWAVNDIDTAALFPVSGNNELVTYVPAPATGNPSCVIGGMIALDGSTVGANMLQRKPQANGYINNWTGNYDNINNKGFNVDLYVSGDTGGSRAAYWHGGGIASIEGSIIVGVTQNVLARGDNGVQMRSFIRVNHVNHDGDLFSPSENWSPHSQAYHTNPDTGLPFTVSDLTSSQIGIATG